MTKFIVRSHFDIAIGRDDYAMSGGDLFETLDQRLGAGHITRQPELACTDRIDARVRQEFTNGVGLIRNQDLIFRPSKKKRKGA